MVKISNSKILMIVTLTCLLFTSVASIAGEPLDITVQPSKAEWQHFNKMNQAQLSKLWQFQVGRGHKSLGDWAWQWRLGWIRQCLGGALPKLCPEILQQGLTDEAMVVRAEAATALGVIYRGQANERIIKNLAKSFMDPRNVRRGSPLFVCDRILAALRNIGGELADETATRLANKHPSTAAYWAKMQKQDL